VSQVQGRNKNEQHIQATDNIILNHALYTSITIKTIEGPLNY